ncbi:MAG: hypothetical protein K6F26_03410 [Lachnospiraceae bacterium]|nr:hypothetical protein [Lachnospiraceae bacterium]
MKKEKKTVVLLGEEKARLRKEAFMWLLKDLALQEMERVLQKRNLLRFLFGYDYRIPMVCFYACFSFSMKFR